MTTDMSTQWFCEKCHRVFGGGGGTCCGVDGIPFDPATHGRYLVSGSNSWIDVWEKWHDHPLVREVAAEHAEHGNHSAPRILNDAIERAFEHLENDREEKG